MKRANFSIVAQESTREVLVIHDEGPWDEHVTVTNDAENVVEWLYANGKLWPGRRLLYYDSLGALDEIVHQNGEFSGFRPYRPAKGAQRPCE